MTVLIVDDEPAVAGAIAEALKLEGHDVLVALAGEEGLEILAATKVDALFLDIAMPGMSGLEVLGRIRELFPDLPVVVISGWAKPAELARARELGAHVLRKPSTLKNLTEVLSGLEKRCRPEHS